VGLHGTALDEAGTSSTSEHPSKGGSFRRLTRLPQSSHNASHSSGQWLERSEFKALLVGW
jgi:hypothetical protein